MGKNRKKTDNSTLKMILQEFDEDPFQKLNIAFALMSVIPFLVFLYVLAARLFTFDVLIGDIGLILAITIFISLCGLIVGYGVLRNILRKVISYAGRARKCSELKSKFVATVSHEFRNPLYLLSSNIKNILEGAPEQVGTEARKQLETCKGETSHMWDLATHLLDVYKIEAGMVKINKKTCNVAGMMEHQVNEMDDKIQKKDISVNREISGEDLSIWADEEKIDLVISNLLSSAISYTSERGSVTLRVFPADEFVRMEIQNTGRNIPEDKVETVFDKAEPLEYKKEEEEIGLAISKDIVELHEGRIWAEAHPGKGNKFIVVLPRKKK